MVFHCQKRVENRPTLYDLHSSCYTTPIHMSKKQIVIIGQGQIGKAIKHLLKKTKHDVSIECWDVDVKTCPRRKPLDKIVPEADILFLCVPSWAIRAAAQDLGHLIKKTTTLVSLSKGLDRSSTKTVDELLKEVFPNVKKIALMSGPMLAEEIVQNMPAAAVVASTSTQAQKELTELFKPTKLHAMPAKDLRGTAICGILKNIYSMGFGMAQSMHPGDNFRGMYMNATINEMEQIIHRLGGDKTTVCSFAGIGDLVATGFSKHSKNHEYGKQLAEKGKVDFDSEGSVSIRPMAKKIGALHKKLPILYTIYQIVAEGKPAKNILNVF